MDILRAFSQKHSIQDANDPDDKDIPWIADFLQGRVKPSDSESYSYDIWYYVGLVARFETKDSEEATRAFQKALETAKTPTQQGQAYHNLGICTNNKEYHKKAVERNCFQSLVYLLGSTEEGWDFRYHAMAMGILEQGQPTQNVVEMYQTVLEPLLTQAICETNIMYPHYKTYQDLCANHAVLLERVKACGYAYGTVRFEVPPIQEDNYIQTTFHQNRKYEELIAKYAITLAKEMHQGDFMNGMFYMNLINRYYTTRRSTERVSNNDKLLHRRDFYEYMIRFQTLRASIPQMEAFLVLHERRLLPRELGLHISEFV
jgi:hypothetical protein